MLKIDHLVVNVEGSIETSREFSKSLAESGYLYNPKWGKGTKGFKASNIWIGDEYFELVYLKTKDGGGWQEDWVQKYNDGHRGLIGFCLETDDIEKECNRLSKTGINNTKPEYLKFKWFFNLFTRTMPWKNSYIEAFEGLPLQFFLQQMKDEKAKEFMKQYMIPNSRDNGMEGILGVKISGNMTVGDIEKVKKLFNSVKEEKDRLTVNLKSGQYIIFQKGEQHRVEIYTKCSNEAFAEKSFCIENVKVINERSK